MGVWPGKAVMEKFVHKADGHFIYVITVMEYLTANDPSIGDLQEQLDAVINTEETTSHPDLSDLDQLYHTILQPFNHIDLREPVMLPLLQLVITNCTGSFEQPLHVMAGLLKLNAHYCFIILSQLRSVIHIPNNEKESVL
ncbi:hypothetical protein PQX77_019721, partial [Marasmius sp. AFHP31]